MIELEVAIAIAAVALLLIIILIISKVRAKNSKKAKTEITKTPGLTEESQEIESVDAPGFNPEPQTKHSEEVQPDEPVFDTDPPVAAQTNETIIPAPENRYKNLPQDSMLRRHYLTHVHAMIESIKSPRPTDSALSRHYDAMIFAEMEQCLSDEAAMEQLVCNYQELKKTLAEQIQKPEAIAEPLIEPVKVEIKQEKPNLPEDFMLRRHYLTHLRSLVESGKEAATPD